MRRFLPTILALAAGVLWALCFGRRPLLLAPWLALVPLMLFLGARRPARLSGLHALAFWSCSIWWIAPTLKVYGGLPHWLSWVLLFVLAAYLALYGVVFGWLGGRFWRLGGWCSWLGIPALWVTLEWVRGWLFTGFPWNLAAYSWAAVPGALPLTAWIGSWGLSALVILVNLGLAEAWRRRSWRIAGFWILGTLTLLAAAARWAGPQPTDRSAKTGVPVRIVQPNIPTLTTYDEAKVLEHYRGLLRLSEQACVPGSLVIWPESAAWPLMWGASPRLRRDVRGLTSGGCWILLNTAVSRSGLDYNAVILVGPNGVAGHYFKRHLVPFGEYVPLGDLLPFVGTLARAAGSFTAAEEVRLLSWRGERLGTAICFEVVFPGETAELVRAGATVLVTVTNDAWYGDTSAPWQHFRAARFRAAETGRPLLRAAITGVSGWIEPDGSIRARLGVGERGILATRLRGREALTPFVRTPWLVPMLAGLVCAFAIFAMLRRRDRRL